MPSPLKLFLAALGSFVLVAGLASPADARPARVATPYITASSPHTLTVTWPTASSATRYVVHVGSTPARAAKAKKRSYRSHGRTASLRIKGLRKNARYCFTVQGVRGGQAGKRSEPICGHTLRRSIKKTASKVSVATFNVCAAAANCRNWTTQREDAIVRRILDANVDVVAVQEITGKADKLAQRLRSHGYAHYTQRERKLDEAIYYRTSALEMGIANRPVEACEVEPYAGLEDTATWRFPRHLDATTQQWYEFRSSGWFTEQPVCRSRQIAVEQEGRIGSPTGATAAWAALRVRATGKTYVFVSAHLTFGPTKSAGRLRGRETKQLIRGAEGVADGAPIIFMGDFNSYRGATDDPPRREMARHGWVDTFENSTTYTRPYVSSSNGWGAQVRTPKSWGGHIDRIFIRTSMGSSNWKIVAKVNKRRYVGTRASDHNLVRATIHLP
ncbi:MAG: endonuclease/exonuclease/phosphatase family protein [Aeromicrobium sp.]